MVSDVEAPPNLSLLVGADDGKVRGINWLYRGGNPVLRARSLDRVLRGAVTHLDAFIGDPPGIRRLNARLLVQGGEAVLIDPWLGNTLDKVERRIERLGYRVADTPGVPFDPDAGEVVLWPPRLDVDETELAGSNGDHSPISADSGEPLRLPLRSAVLWGGPTDAPMSPAQVLAAFSGLVASGDEEFERDHLYFARQLVLAGAVHTCPSDKSRLVSTLRDMRS